MDDSFRFEDEPTKVTSYTSLAAEALAWQAEFEQRAVEMERLVASLARGTREWVRK